MDEYTTESLAIDVAGSIRSTRVIEVLSQLISVRGTPRVLRSDNGPEFVSRALLRWVAQQGPDMALIDPGKPWQNGTAESFNGKFRDECLAMEWFRNRIEAKIVIETWRRHYNEVRPHSSLKNLTPTHLDYSAAWPPLNRRRFPSIQWSEETQQVSNRENSSLSRMPVAIATMVESRIQSRRSALTRPVMTSGTPSGHERQAATRQKKGWQGIENSSIS